MLPKKPLPKLEIKKKENIEKKKPNKLTTRLPKSEYDEAGDPILNIEVDDLNLNESASKLLKGGIYK